MGLEIVEVIMRVEEEFDIEILDEEAETLNTVGRLYECVLQKLKVKASATASGQPAPQEVWDALRAALADELSVPIEKLTAETDFVRDLNLG